MFIFNGVTKVITLDVGVVAFNAIDLYSDWKDWILLSDNSKYPQAMSNVGGEDIGGGATISPYFFVINGWVIKPQEANHTLVVTGNLISESGGSPFINTTGNYNVRIISIVSSNATSLGGDPTIVADAVWEYTRV